MLATSPGGPSQQCGSTVCQQCGQHTTVSPSPGRLYMSSCALTAVSAQVSFSPQPQWGFVWEGISRELLGPAACPDF